MSDNVVHVLERIAVSDVGLEGGRSVTLATEDGGNPAHAVAVEVEQGDRMQHIRLSEEHHGPPSARHFEYEPTWVLRGLHELHIEFTPVDA